jgi:FkbM family methyltransferase
MLETIQPGMRVVDVGAHLGYIAMLASELVGKAGRVVAFEPQRQIAEWTGRNLRPYPQARLVKMAAGDDTGIADFIECDLARSGFSGRPLTGAPAGLPDAGHRYQVPVTTLDGALRPDERPVDFIKVDVEGSEMAVLNGAHHILRRDRPLIVLEAEMPAANGPRPRVREFARWLEPMGYIPVGFEFSDTLLIGAVDEVAMGHANVAFVHPSRAEFRDLHAR